MQNLKIGIVCYPSIGGSGVVATNLGMELAKLGHEIHFISYEKPFLLNGKNHKNIFFHKVNISDYPLFKYPDYTLPLAVTIGNVHEKFQLDILHVHYAVPHATAALLACQMIQTCSHCRPPKIITTLHGTDITLLAQDKNLFEIIKYSVERSNAVTAVSEYLNKKTCQVLNTRKKIQTIYNFYSPKKPGKPRAQMRQSLNLRAASLNIKDTDVLGIHLSNLRPVKRIPDLLKAAALTKAPHFKLLIIAGNDFKPFKPLVKKLNLSKKIVVKEKIQDIENYINASDFGFFSSEEESFGMGILECMAYGLPVVSTNAGGIPEVLEDGVSGFLSKIGNVQTLAKNAQKLITDPLLRTQMGENAKLRASVNFSTKPIVNRYINLYKNLLAR